MIILGKKYGAFPKDSMVKVNRKYLVPNGIGECLEIDDFSSTYPYSVYIKTNDINMRQFPIDSKITYGIDVTDYTCIPYREIDGIKYPIKGVRLCEVNNPSHKYSFKTNNEIWYYFIFDEETISLLPQETKGTYLFDPWGKFIASVNFGTTIEASGMAFSENINYISLLSGTAGITVLELYDIKNKREINISIDGIYTLRRYFWINNTIIYTHVLIDKPTLSDSEFSCLSNVEKYNPITNTVAVIYESNNLQRAVLVGVVDDKVIIELQTVLSNSDWANPDLISIKYILVNPES